MNHYAVPLVATATPYALFSAFLDSPIAGALAALALAGTALLWEHVYRLRRERQRLEAETVTALEDKPTDPGER